MLLQFSKPVKLSLVQPPNPASSALDVRAHFLEHREHIRLLLCCSPSNQAAVLLIPTISVVFPEFKEALTADVLVGIDLGTTYSVVATCTRK